MYLRLWMFIVLVYGLTSASAAFACRCREPKSTQEAYDNARAVIIAKVVELQADARGDGVTAVLLVTHAWKQDLPARLIVVSATTCKYDLKPGGDYLLFLGHDPKMLRGADPKTFTTGICLGNETLAAADKAIQWLNNHGRASSIQPGP